MKGLLLDTHVWLWSLVDPARLGDSLRLRMTDRGTPLHLSAASSWEISIKYRLGKLPLPCPPAEFILPRLARDGILSLAVDHRHSVEVAGLPDHHRDPFDRLLIAQARIEGLTLATADPALQHYDVDLVLAGG